jgi:(4S)-4-hydroxy-5-phosphonooxypentane-2,3-dione isomerase
MSYALVAIYRVQPGAEEAVEEALRAMTELTRAEPGCLSYTAHRSPEESNVFFLYELYRGEDAFQTHASSDYFGRYIKDTVWPLLEDRRRILGTPIA